MASCRELVSKRCCFGGVLDVVIVYRYNFLTVNLSTYKINKLPHGWLACTVFIHLLCLVKHHKTQRVDKNRTRSSTMK